ncbi:UNKNOWN [Stylonychia lemnae]|uniref:Thioesterase domain-containing protein n=1 Tax=Stylonychia lemnae TaxID=5949 RepID=A0A078ABR9_STYLE|nr:UNKNOWN [Stylonychia lemnae]|eukprot:CDW79634.1 UNKNOWN [Stylonychia lemnae]
MQKQQVVFDKEVVRSNLMKVHELAKKPQFQETFGKHYNDILRLDDVIFEEGVVGIVHYKFKIPDYMVDSNGNAHRRALLTMTDVIPYFAILGFESRQGISVQLSTEFLNDAPVDQDLLGICRIIKLGRGNAFTDCTIINPKNNLPLVKGSLTMNFVESRHKL